MVSALLAGLAPVSDTFVPPDDVRWPWIQEALVRYEYSATRAQQLAADLGWQRGSDGTFNRAGGEPATIQIRSTPGQEKEIAIVADYWRAAGFGVEERPLSIGESRDQRLVSLFPAIHYASLPLSFQQDLQRVHGRLCPTEQTNWTGTNRGCYLNPSMDQVADALQTAIDPREQQRLWRELVRAQSEDLPLLPLYFNIQVELYRQGLTGVVGTARPEGAQTWNIADWDLVT
jgi:peptide/nickel transport system substrate-binding protein